MQPAVWNPHARYLQVSRKRLAAAEAWHLSFRSLHLSDMDSGDTIARVNQQVMTRIDVPFALPSQRQPSSSVDKHLAATARHRARVPSASIWHTVSG